MPEQTPMRRRSGYQAHRAAYPDAPVRVRVPRAYGPHRDEAHATTVTILQQDGKGAPVVERTVPLPHALVRQRRQLNNLAYDQGQAALKETADADTP